jgi:hypothetical protein
MTIRSKFILLSLLLFPLWSAKGDLRDEVDEVISLAQAPPGVVFEIISGDPDRLVTLVPRLRQESERLRARFQGLSIAIVTHGAEQFALTTDKIDRYGQLHSLVKQITTSEDIPVHVCGTHASWYGIPPDAFPDYVDVAAVGPAQAQQYVEVGYRLIVVE